MDPSEARPPMKRITAKDPESRSSEPVADNIAHLARLFPEAFTEGKVNFAVLRELLGDAIEAIMRLQLLEDEFDLPACRIDLSDGVGVECRTDASSPIPPRHARHRGRLRRPADRVT